MSLLGISVMVLIWLLCPTRLAAKDFVVVIDAGHGGHDPGAIGRISREKNINLNVALKLGKLIEANCRDVKVVYTRKTDVFIPLNRRAEIANNAKADLFISIHTNALAKNKVAKGASTWTLGLAKSEANLDVAKRENSVILYENDYQTRYAGFDPNSSESYIIFEFMQDKYMAQSVDFASIIQRQFRQAGRIDNRVHQAGFLVLKASAMPSVLIELGFISTPEEEKYLNSENGISTMANSIYKAFLSYKEGQQKLPGLNQAAEAKPTAPPVTAPAEPKAETDRPDSAASTTRDAEPTPLTQSATPTPSTTRPRQQPASAEPKQAEAPVFKIQILASSSKLATNDRRLKNLNGVGYYVENNVYKYTCEESTNYNRVKSRLASIRTQFKGAFIVAFKGDEKIEVNKAIQEFMRLKR